MPPPRLDLSNPHIEDSPKHIRVYFGGQLIVDTKKSKFMYVTTCLSYKILQKVTATHTDPPYACSWDGYSPSYYFSNSDVPQQYLKRHGDGTVPGSTLFDIVVNSGTAPKAAIQYEANSSSPLAGLTKIAFKSMDAWFEEDEQIYGGPKNPYHVRCQRL